MKRKQAGIPKPATPPSPGEYTVANSSGADTVSETYPSRAAARRAAVDRWGPAGYRWVAFAPTEPTKKGKSK